jgi:hypothetical protein
LLSGCKVLQAVILHTTGFGILQLPNTTL